MMSHNRPATKLEVDIMYHSVKNKSSRLNSAIPLQELSGLIVYLSESVMISVCAGGGLSCPPATLPLFERNNKNYIPRGYICACKLPEISYVFHAWE